MSFPDLLAAAVAAALAFPAPARPAAPAEVAPAAAVPSPKPHRAEGASRQGREGRVQVVTIEVTGEGFLPARVSVKAGRPVQLLVTRKTDRTCATEIVIRDYGILKPLPLGEPVEVALTPKSPGPIRYACAMDMIAGALVAE